MKNNLKELYDLMLDKNGYINLLSKEFNRSEKVIRSSWISNNKLPDHFKVRSIELAHNFLLCQNKQVNKIINLV